jgi:hypothetical protein
MPRFNTRGDIVMGVGGHPASINNQQVTDGFGGAACWLDDDNIIVNAPGGLTRIRWSLVLARQILDPRGANEIAAGGGRYAAWLAGTGVYGPWDMPESGLAGANQNDGRGAASREGAIGIVPTRQTGIGLHILLPDGSVKVYGGVVPWDLHLFTYQGETIGISTIPGVGVRIFPTESTFSTSPVLLPGATFIKTFVPPGSLPWLVYYAPGVGLVAHPWGGLIGYVITQGLAFYYDAHFGADRHARVAFALNAAETPGSGEVVDLARLTITNLAEINVHEDHADHMDAPHSDHADTPHSDLPTHIDVHLDVPPDPVALPRPLEMPAYTPFLVGACWPTPEADYAPHLLDPRRLADLRVLGLNALRIDLNIFNSIDNAVGMLVQVAGNGLIPWPIIHLPAPEHKELSFNYVDRLSLQLRAFTSGVAKRCPWVKEWEIGNEYAGLGNLTGKAYAHMINLVGREIRNEITGTTIWISADGLMGGSVPNRDWRDIMEFADPRWYDGIAIHPYRGSHDFRWADGYIDRADELRDLRARSQHRRIAVTECGWRPRDLGEDGAAFSLINDVHLWRLASARAYFIYAYVTTDPADYGLLRADSAHPDASWTPTSQAIALARYLFIDPLKGSSS